MEPSKRRVVHRSPARKVWQLNLTHFQPEPIEAESSYERDFVYISALYPYCKRIQHQPFRMDLPSGKYTPDFRIDFQDASTAIVEVKPEEKSAAYAQTFAEAARAGASREPQENLNVQWRNCGKVECSVTRAWRLNCPGTATKCGLSTTCVTVQWKARWPSA